MMLSFVQGSYVYEFTAKDLGEVATSLKQDVIVPSASALKHKIQVLNIPEEVTAIVQ